MTEWPQVDLVGVGLNATDTLIPLGDLPDRGSKVEYRNASVMPGGQVATTVVACQTWGLRTRYVGKLGDDDAARLHEEAFDARGRGGAADQGGRRREPAVADPGGCGRRAHRALPARRAAWRSSPRN